MAATLLTTAQVAEALHTDPKTLRKFLRADAKETGATTPGKGARYSIEARKVAALRSRFNRWTQAQEVARQEREAARTTGQDAPEAPAEVEVEQGVEDSLDSLEGPTDDDLAEVDAN